MSVDVLDLEGEAGGEWGMTSEEVKRSRLCRSRKRRTKQGGLWKNKNRIWTKQILCWFNG